MMNHRLYPFICLCVCLLTSVSCDQCKDRFQLSVNEQEPLLVKVPIQVGQLPMDNISSDTRATIPMGPEQENPIRTLTVVQFDSEGNMLRINPGNNQHPYYHFIDLTTADNPSGVLSTDLDDVSLFVDASRNTRVCLIANETEDEAGTLLWNEQEDRNRLWNEFRLGTIEIPYKLTPPDSLGHVNDVYMYGHYEGILNLNSSGQPVAGNSNKLSVSLARVITRVEMSVKLGDNVQLPEGYHIFWGMYNVEKSAYLVPGAAEYLSEEVIHNHVVFGPVDRTDKLSTEAQIFYFYMAPHIVLNTRNNTTYFAIWCVPNGITAEKLEEDKKKAEENGKEPIYRYAKILICNDPLTEEDKPSAEGAYWLNRNSIYHMNLTLTYEDSRTFTRRLVRGEYEINLNKLIK